MYIYSIRYFLHRPYYLFSLSSLKFSVTTFSSPSSAARWFRHKMRFKSNVIAEWTANMAASVEQLGEIF